MNRGLNKYGWMLGEEFVGFLFNNENVKIVLTRVLFDENES